MATQHNFRIKNGLEVAGTQRISSAGVITGTLDSNTTATTQSALDNSTKIATTAYTDAAITAVIGGAPGTLDTLNELAAAINDDASYATTLTTALAGKLALTGGTLTGGLNIRGFNGPVLKIGSSGSADPRIDFEDQNSTSLAAGIFFDQDTDTLRILRTVSGSATDGIAINASGKVGIGVTDPDNPLEVFGADSGIKISSASNNRPHLRFECGSDEKLRLSANAVYGAIGDSSDTNRYMGFKDGKVGVGTTNPSTKLEVIDANSVGLRFGDIASTPSSQTAGYVGMSTSAYSGNNGDLVLIPRTSVTSRILLMEGNVGIGTTSPEHHLHVTEPGATNEDGIVKIGGSAASLGLELRYNQASATEADIIANPSYTNANAIMRLAVDGDANPNQLVLKGDGNVGIGTSSPAKPLHVKRTSGWATMRLEGASDSGGEISLYAGSTLKAKLWADNSAGDIIVRPGGVNTTVRFDADGNWVSPHEDNIKRNFIGRGPFNVMDFSDTWHEYYNPAANTEHHISGSFLNPMGITMAFPSNVTKKILQHERTPTGSVGVIYEAVSDSNSTYNGGFNTDYFKTDPDKGYVMGYYVRRISSASSGTHYGGFSHGVAAGTGSSVDSNPYFQSFGNGNLPQGVWCLCYYQLHPRYYSGTGDGGIAGVYRCDNGTRILGQTAWKQPVNQTQQILRSYNYYCANTSVAIQWYSPFVYEVTGFEPTVAAMLGRGI
tara:strand:+ start:603 stop:2765 length:2163 start_codon:yes stop_codon:yes gene_type:complete